ncbi:MAG: Gfo/Idh/MocA family oxidoreductase [Ktedonobacteraceae bacterium]
MLAMEDTLKGQLRYAIIGVGAGVLSMHRQALALPSVQLVAVSDIVSSLAQQRAAELHCAFYTDHRRLLAETHPDVAVVMTPHLFHASIATDCLAAGSHVLIEKPMAVEVAQADDMLAAAEQHQRLIGVIFQQRFRPEIRAARAYIQAGRLGSIQHIDMTAIWTRTARYYSSASWRGTWAGEGGGVLMNQAPHQLDVLCHLVGLPARVFAWTRRLLHHIETEDTVQAALEWSSGALGSLHISTAEVDQAEYLKIVGTRGQLELSSGKLVLRELDADLADFIASSPEAIAAPKLRDVEIDLEPGKGGKGDHLAVYQAFNNAILHGIPFTSAGVEGRMSLELANALIYSNYTHAPVDLPLDRQKYAALLDDLRAKRRVL